MSDSLKIWGTDYTGVKGFKASDTNDNQYAYVRPQGTKSISQNGTGINVAEYETVDVNVSGGAVNSVNGQTGDVDLDASDVGAYALPSGGIPSTDMTSAVQASLGKADTAYQKPSGGIPKSDLASDVQTSLGKADTALQSAPVTSVDGKTGAVTILPTGGTIGQTLEKTSGNNYQVKWGNKVSAGVVDTLNPFSPVLNFLPRIDRLENALYFADKRWTVTGYKEEIATGIQTDLNASSLANLFDFNSSSCIGIDDGYKIVVTMDFGSPNGVFPNYPYGVLCISFYYNNSPASVSARVYGKHTGDTWYWSNLTVNDVSLDGTHIQYQANQSGMYNMQKLEVTVVGQTAGSAPGYTQINDISYYLSRGTKDNDMPYVSKLRAEKLYYDLTVPNVLLTDGKNVKTLLGSIPSAATATPADLGTAAVGSSSKYAKEDHVHNKPTYTKSDVGLGNVDNVQQYSATNPPPYPVTSVNGATGAVTVSEVFWATYGTTTSAQINAADSAGKIVMCKRNGSVYLMVFNEENYAIFTCVDSDSKTVYSLICNENAWSNDSVGVIPAPASPATGAFLVWNGSAWVAQTLSTWQGGSY